MHELSSSLANLCLKSHQLACITQALTDRARCASFGQSARNIAEQALASVHVGSVVGTVYMPVDWRQLASAACSPKHVLVHVGLLAGWLVCPPQGTPLCCALRALLHLAGGGQLHLFALAVGTVGCLVCSAPPSALRSVGAGPLPCSM